jgi:hypothetical protein
MVWSANFRIDLSHGKNNWGNRNENYLHSRLAPCARAQKSPGAAGLSLSC